MPFDLSALPVTNYFEQAVIFLGSAATGRTFDSVEFTLSGPLRGAPLTLFLADIYLEDSASVRCSSLSKWVMYTSLYQLSTMVTSYIFIGKTRDNE
mmetsp:Transcript_37607/g.52229  ORF Transcript_37607/g.52229 Transcript_37607/m.52229 type:complete len:96 (+) Transcript_37607:172-459(+)